jgi:hypothetical protein
MRMSEKIIEINNWKKKRQSLILLCTRKGGSRSFALVFGEREVNIHINKGRLKIKWESYQLDRPNNSTIARRFDTRSWVNVVRLVSHK